MKKHDFARSFKELIVYQKSREVSKALFVLTSRFPKEEMYSLTDQIRRSSRSIGAQIAEAWAKRRYPNHFTSKLTDADGEQLESQHWLTTAYDCEYISEETLQSLTGEFQEIGKMLQRMIDRADSFAGHVSSSLKESPSHYGSINKFFINTEHRTLNTEY